VTVCTKSRGLGRIKKGGSKVVEGLMVRSHGSGVFIGKSSDGSWVFIGMSSDGRKKVEIIMPLDVARTKYNVVTMVQDILLLLRLEGQQSKIRGTIGIFNPIGE